MPRPGLTVAVLPVAALLVAAPFAAAQTPFPPTGQPGGRIPVPGADAPPGGQTSTPADPKLLAYLNGWEAVMQNAVNFYATADVVRKNNVTKKESALKGDIRCLKPNLARVRLDAQAAAPGQPPRANESVLYICDGKSVFEYDFPSTTVTEYRLQNGAGVGDNLLLEFMSGTLKARDLLQRFDMRLTKEDANYIFLEVGARLPKDRAEFQTMTLVLHQPTIPGKAYLGYLPRMVVISKKGGDAEETWQFPNPVVNAQGIKPADFQPFPLASLPKGWKSQLGNAAAAPAPPAGPVPGQPVGRPR